jgi:hypothetical protein
VKVNCAAADAPDPTMRIESGVMLIGMMTAAFVPLVAEKLKLSMP